MHPYIHTSLIDLPVYGLLVVVGAAAAVGVSLFQCGHLRYSRSEAFMAALIAFVGGMAGAKILSTLVNLAEFLSHMDRFAGAPLKELLLWMIGGYVYYGGFLGGLAATIIYCRHFKMPVLRLSDVFAPAVPIGHAFGRVGCFFGGCCYGMEVSASNKFAVIYPQRFDGLDAVSAPAGVPLLASPLIEAGGNILIGVAIIIFQRRHGVSGRGAALYGILYGCMRFTLEFFRGDLIRGVYGVVSTSQIISICVVAVSVFVFVKASVQRPATTQPQEPGTP